MLAALIGALGMGDAKLSFPYATILAWFGSTALQLAGVATIVTAGVFVLVVLVRQRTRSTLVAFGPFMALGLVAAVLAIGPSG